jgi:hypothetical protein
MAFGFDLPGCPWDGYTPGTIRFCEDRVCGWIAEPANAWSNLAFVAMGFYLMRRAHRDGRTPLHLVGITSVMVGLASFLFHMSGTFWGEFLDLCAMFFIGALMVTMEARRFVTMGRAQLAACFVGLSAISILLLLVFRKIGIVLFGLQVAFVYVNNIFLRGKHQKRQKVVHRHAVWLGMTFATALGIWTLDITGVVCRPGNHVFNGHSVWHILTALCLYFFYRHQEQFVPAQPRGMSTV